jgi:nitroimidazol reductase NimA-like FMN-containing flavoprotein (pyridoxamine 5'-phosphate oxidase superfamily)
MAEDRPEMLQPTARTTVRRKAERGRYDRTTITAILDEGIVAHVGFAGAQGVCVLPMVYARVDDKLYLHGAVGNSMLKALQSGVDVCVTVTLVDALVLSRSAFHHSVNYRSVVLVGTAVAVNDGDELDTALRAVVDHMVPGRSNDCRGPSAAELRKTRVIALPITEASAKIRTGPPIEEAEDLALPYWGGLLPVVTSFGAPVADEFVPGERGAPEYRVTTAR